MRLELTVLLGVFVLCAAFSFAGINTWTICRIGGQDIGYKAVTINPLDDNIFYCTNLGAHSKTTTLFRSTDRGVTWSPFSFLPESIEYLAFSSDTKVMYIAIYSNLLYTSNDGGLTYFISTTGMPSNSIDCILASSQNPSVAYAGFNVVYKTTDQGSTWAACSSGAAVGGYVSSIVEDPQNPNNLYITGYRGYVCKSINGGNTWSYITTGLNPPGDEWRAIAVHPTNSNILFVLPEQTGCIYKSINSGVSWSTITSGIPINRYNMSLAFLPSNPSTMFLGCGNGMLQSIDEGNTWHSFNNGNTGMNLIPIQIALTKTKPHTILVGGVSSAFTYTIVDTGIIEPEWQTYDKGLQDGIFQKGNSISE